MYNLIPKPVTLTDLSGEFTLSNQTSIQVDTGLNELGQYLSTQIEQLTNLKLQITQPSSQPNCIQLTLSNDQTFGEEGYSLFVTSDVIRLEAHQKAGLFYGIQTLRQMLTSVHPTLHLSAVSIADSPRFKWRGVMLDVARHFFGVEDIKHYIDLVSHYKINRLHLHLTDDQGWRIEIKAWQRLTTVGASTQVNGGGGGFYTQDQFKEIVDYARSRHVMIIPEIDTPGHTNAALASYAELNASEEAPELYEGTEVGFSTLNINSELTYQFLEDVISELCAISPAPYIHIGGDEAKSTPEAEYRYFIKRFQQLVLSHNKIPIGWAEIGEADLDPRTIAQHWQGAAYQDARRQGCKIILSPANKTYLDMKYDENSPLGLDWVGFISVKDSYDWNPTTYMYELEEADILGVEAPIWTETILTMKDIEFMVFPRLPGLAELSWSSNSEGWDEYQHRLAKHGRHLRALDINFFHSPDIAWE